MDFETPAISFLASAFLVFKRSIQLALFPYKTMRKIHKEIDWWQFMIIFILIFFYFFTASKVRPSSYEYPFLFIITVINVMLTVYFFYYLASIFDRRVQILPFLYSFSYTLIPTLLGFLMNLLLYVLIPPPRTASIFGKTFSILYIIFVISILFWKLILVYLSIRFSFRLHTWRIVYFLLLYLCLFIPYAFFLYQLGFFRIPFI